MLTGALRYCRAHRLPTSRIAYTWQPAGRDLATVGITVPAP